MYMVLYWKVLVRVLYDLMVLYWKVLVRVLYDLIVHIKKET